MTVSQSLFKVSSILRTCLEIQGVSYNSGLASLRTLLRSLEINFEHAKDVFAAKKPFLTQADDADISKKYSFFHFHVVHSNWTNQCLLLDARSFPSGTAATLLGNVFSSFLLLALRRRNLGIFRHILCSVFEVLGQTEGCCCWNYGLG